MNNIIERQNEDRFIRYLKAQRVAYSQAKSLHIFDWFAVILALVTPLVVVFFKDKFAASNSNLENILSGLGFLWSGIFLFSVRYRSQKTEQAAKIQEEFDTELFGIPWNDVLCDEKVTQDNIRDLSKKYFQNDLRDWYSQKIHGNLPEFIAILLCQKINFSWDVGLKKDYKQLLFWLGAFCAVVFILAMLYTNSEFRDVLKFSFPTISFLFFVFTKSFAISDQISSKESTQLKIEREIDLFRKNGILPDKERLREFQDKIYEERKSDTQVPDRYYNWHKKTNKTEKSIDESVEEVVKFL